MASKNEVHAVKEAFSDSEGTRENLVEKRCKKESTLEFIKNFMSKFEEGYSVMEIADMYNVSRFTAYRYLDEIAKANNTAKEQLLKRHRKKVNEFIENFMSNFEEGYSVTKIAKMYNIPYAVSSRYYDEIARKNGMSREKFMQKLQEDPKRKERDQRTVEFIKNFMAKYEEGNTAREIADMYGLSYTRAYDLLQEIADENGVERDSLLQRVVSKKGLRLASKPRESVDAEKLLKATINLGNRIDFLILAIEKTLEKTLNVEEEE